MTYQQSARNTPRTCLMIAAWFCVIGAPDGARAADPAGFIVDIRGAPGTIVIERNGERAPGIWEPVFGGDVIHVRNANSSLLIEGRAGPVQIGVECKKGGRVLAACSPYQVVDAPMSAFARLADILARLFAEPPRLQEVNLQGRSATGPQLAVEGDRHRLVAGRRSVFLPLRFGTPPFRVTIRQGATTTGPFTGDTRIVRTPAIEMREGAATLEFLDSAGLAGFVEVEFVKAAPRPQGLDDSPELSEFQATLWAGWLAAHPSKQWSLEAVQRLAPIARAYPAAQGLLMRISGLSDDRS